VWPTLLVGGQSLRRALQVNPSVRRAIEGTSVRRATALVLAGLVAVGGAIAFLLVRGTPLPPVSKPCFLEVFPKHDLESIETGMTPDQVAAHFETSVASLEEGCVAFGYDEDLVGDNRHITVLFRGGKVSDRWLEEAAFSHKECEGVPRLSIPLKGYAHAGVC